MLLAVKANQWARTSRLFAFMSTQIYINIDVDDLERAIAFYSVGLNLVLKRRLFGGRVAELTGGTSTIHLLTHAAESAPVPHLAESRDYDRHWTPVHLDFVVPDIDKALAAAIAAGAKLEREVQNYSWGKIAGVADPFGHGICLIQLLGAGYDDVSC